MSTARNYMRHRNDRKYQRKAAAEERKKLWDSKSPQEQLDELNARLGDGVGAVKQRARLQAKLDESKKAKESEEKTEKAKPKKNKRG